MLPKHPNGVAGATFLVPTFTNRPESRVEQGSQNGVTNDLVQPDQQPQG